jgi:hypothetical protein
MKFCIVSRKRHITKVVRSEYPPSKTGFRRIGLGGMTKSAKNLPLSKNLLL